MGKFDAYKIDLKGMKNDTYSCEYVLDNHFFESIDSPEVQKGKVHVALTVKKTAGLYELSFKTEGIVQVTCDRCLDDMDQPVTSTDMIKVKLGEDFSESGDIVIIPEETGEINVAWFMYEFIALSIPMKHVHAPGKCNKAMMGTLNKYLRVSADENAEEMEVEEETADDKEQVIDPRWNELKKIIDNN